MNVVLTDNQTRVFLDELKPRLQEAGALRAAVAFVTRSGVSLVEEEIKDCLDRGGVVEVITGLDFRLTEGQALRYLQHLGARVYCYSDPSLASTPMYHPKMYLISREAETTLAIGSSNLTDGGLRSNVEVNLLLDLPSESETVSDGFAAYHLFKAQPARFEPDDAFLEAYDELASRVGSAVSQATETEAIRDGVARLRAMEAGLPRPRVSPADLVGWQKIVYERLPSGRFQTGDIYNFEEEFRKHYPENRHIRAKIRQVLQQLRDLGLIRHLDRDLWER